ncbi:MAG: response regulator [Verrucomicrobiota bacterium]|jgi:PAS domain S-box-containing protein
MHTSVELKNNRILVIDDNPSIHDDIRKILAGQEESEDALAGTKALLFGEEPSPLEQARFEIESAFQGQEGLAKVQEAEAAGRPFALAFVDVRMPPGWDGVETINRIWQTYPNLQVVICTAYSDYSWEEMIGRIGKSDSLVVLKKPFDNIEVLQLAHALTEKWHLSQEVKCRLKDLDQLVSQRTTELQSANEHLKKEIEERMLLENALRLSEERFSKAFKASPIPLAIQSLRLEKYVDANLGFQKLTGYSRDELVDRTPQELSLWGDPSSGTAMLRTLQDQMSVRNMPCRLRTKSNQLREILLSVELFELEGEPFFLTIAQDVTEQLKLENQLRQAQKMEAVGPLAAGVAHDFNNIITVVQGHASLLLAAKPPESPDTGPLRTIAAAAERASKLVRQLLTFSRKQVIQMRPVTIQDTLSAVSDMLRRVLGEHIAVRVNAPPPPLWINADAGMMEQMLMNLAVNARDAMPQGGLLTISAEPVELSPSLGQTDREAHPGRFVRIGVADTGCGIPPELLPRIFEPFFTTKPVGKGTGLGLATVYGIAKQHAGWVEVQSQPGQGSTFHIFIPAGAAGPEPGPAPSTPSPSKGGDETILVVEDEEEVRGYVTGVLKSYGYKVLSANSGKEALELRAEVKDKIHLLLTDMVMPGGLSGRQLADHLLAEDTALRVIYTSGYSPGVAGKDLSWLKGRDFLAKPYEPATLLQRVRTSLDGQPVPTGGARAQDSCAASRQ